MPVRNSSGGIIKIQIKTFTRLPISFHNSFTGFKHNTSETKKQTSKCEEDPRKEAFMFRRSIGLRVVFFILFVGALALGGYTLYQSGLSDGFAAGLIAESAEGLEELAPFGRPGMYGYGPYRGFGFSPIFWGFGLFFRLIFWFFLFGFIFRFFFFRRAWGWHGKHKGSRKEWEEHWQKRYGGKPPWMRNDDEPEVDDSEQAQTNE